jgi:hypothetical protein
VKGLGFMFGLRIDLRAFEDEGSRCRARGIG